jgi:imidazolonepropionase-like amidohydrolase
MRYLLSISFIVLFSLHGLAQETFPENGAATYNQETIAFINAFIHIDSKTSVANGTMLVKEGKVVEAGEGVYIPVDAVTIDLAGAHIYPSFIDLYSDYGISENKKAERKRGPQMERSEKGAFGWNEAVRPEYHAVEEFKHDKKKREALQKAGFGVVLSHHKDGIIRGTGVLTSLSAKTENETVISSRAAQFHSFSKGRSKQDYPRSLMGSVALLRQTMYDMQWHKSGQSTETNLSLEALAENMALPQFMECTEKNDIFRANSIASEFGFKYIIKGSGDEYERASDIAVSGNHLILPLDFPEAFDVSNPFEAINIPLSKLRRWEQAPANASYLYSLGVDFSFTAHGLKDAGSLIAQVRKVIENGLTESVALAALTENPARVIGQQSNLGRLAKGYQANFLISSGPIFNKGSVIYENWTQGNRNIITSRQSVDVAGTYDLNINGQRHSLLVKEDKGSYSGSIRKSGTDTSKVKVDITLVDRLITLSMNFGDDSKKGVYRLTGTIASRGNLWDGKGQDPNGNWVNWSAILKQADNTPPKPTEQHKDKRVSRLTYPNMAYGWSEKPMPKDFVIRNATLWTNEEEGVMQDADIVVRDGKIVAVGHNLNLDVVFPKKKDKGDFVNIEAYGKHVTSGVIDEHSHIAITRGVNEGTQVSSAEVRIGDSVNPDDISIYRQLAGGVTVAQLLHGSANPIGGQSALIKLRWGLKADQLKIRGADGFIKFALGENVKQSNWGDQNTIRFPQTRMGVEQAYYDHFIRAREYKSTLGNKRRDLELDAIAEIMDKKRFITCHSYVQSEINMLMSVADSMNFTINTITHILEGYKLADKMKEHGAAGSTFSDWWAYKFEVNEAIPYNAALMAQQGVLVGINSDDAEMARRLNQEAAKAVKYGGVSEEEAWKMVTLNPAKMLHLDERMGSLKEGKDADIVIWSDNPLSIYAKAEQTYVDGIKYYDINEDKAMRAQIEAERNALIQKMLEEGAGSEGKKHQWTPKKYYHCDDMEGEEHGH